MAAGLQPVGLSAQAGCLPSEGSAELAMESRPRMLSLGPATQAISAQAQR